MSTMTPSLFNAKIEELCSVSLLPVFSFSLGSETFGLALCFAGNQILLISFRKVAFHRFPTSAFFFHWDQRCLCFCPLMLSSWEQ